MRDNTRLIEGLQEFSITLTEEQQQKFEKYYDLLIEWNKFMNLTTIVEYEEVIVKHFLDSLALVKLGIINNNSKVIDVGTGAGFPGIPLKIIFPEMDLVLMDSLNKRIKFLDEVILKLSFNKVITVHARAEELGRKEEYRERFDLCVSRAVAKLVSLAEYCMPFVKKEGFFVSYKGIKVKEEIQEASYAINQFGGKIEKIQEFVLPKSDMVRTLAAIKKTKLTPDVYPRAGGKPLNAPLMKG